MREYYRLWLLSVSDIIKLSYFCKQLKISQSNLSNFLKYNDQSLNDNKVKELYDTIKTYMRDFA